MSFDEVTEHSVYTCTGQPLPTDIAKIVEWMLNKDFSSAYQGEKNSTLEIDSLVCPIWPVTCGRVQAHR